MFYLVLFSISILLTIFLCINATVRSEDIWDILAGISGSLLSSILVSLLIELNSNKKMNKNYNFILKDSFSKIIHELNQLLKNICKQACTYNPKLINASLSLTQWFEYLGKEINEQKNNLSEFYFKVENLFRARNLFDMIESEKQTQLILIQNKIYENNVLYKFIEAKFELNKDYPITDLNYKGYPIGNIIETLKVDINNLLNILEALDYKILSKFYSCDNVVQLQILNK